MTARPKPLVHREKTVSPRLDIPYLVERMGVKPPSSDGYASSLPFSPRDVTAGVENELQTLVQGKKQDVDLAIAIETSSYYKNLMRRTESGDSPRKIMADLEKLQAPDGPGDPDPFRVHPAPGAVCPG